MSPSRRMSAAVGLSLLAHASLLAILPRAPGSMPAQVASALQTINVEILPPARPAEPVAPTVPEPAPAPRPQPREPPQARPRAIAKAPAPPVVERPRAPPAPAPEPAASQVAPPPLDMLAMLDARRTQRRAMEDAYRRRMPPVEAPQPDALTRNLQTLTGREGVSGVFQILRKGTTTGEFAFNGWRQDAPSRWREVYEVDAGPGGNIELALVRRMIELIRTHYTGDFNWESHRLGRVVVLSARAEDNEGLEDFLMREFFGTPVVKAR